MFSTIRTVLGETATSSPSARATTALFARVGRNIDTNINLALFVGSFTPTFRAHFPGCTSWLQPSRTLLDHLDKRRDADIPRPRREKCTRGKRQVATVRFPLSTDAAVISALADHYRGFKTTDEAPVPDQSKTLNSSVVPEARPPHRAPVMDLCPSPHLVAPACQYKRKHHLVNDPTIHINADLKQRECPASAA